MKELTREEMIAAINELRSQGRKHQQSAAREFNLELARRPIPLAALFPGLGSKVKR